MPLVAPRLIALDSSHYAQLAKDSVSDDRARRRGVTSFLKAMNDRGYLLLFSFSHLEEILRNENDGVVKGCFDFLSSLPFIAWITGFDPARIVGSVVDILAFEAKAALQFPDASAIDVRDIVRQNIFQFGTGQEMVEPCLEVWPVLRQELLRRIEHTREVAAIYRSDFAGDSTTKLKDLLKLPLRSASDVSTKLHALEAALVADIKAHGDRRLKDPAATSEKFFLGVRSEVSAIFESGVHPIAHIMQLHDIELCELSEEVTTEDIENIATFRSKLRIANQSLRASWTDLKRVVTEERIPSGIIQTGLRRFGQDHSERKGSDLGDTYLACLAPYADLTFVDKRTLENFFRARKKQQSFEEVIRFVDKAGHYDLIPSKVDNAFANSRCEPRKTSPLP